MVIVPLLLVYSVCVAKGLTYEDERDPVQLNGPLWEKIQTASRAFTTPTTSTNLNSPLDTDSGEYGDFPSNNALKDFLDNYAETLRKEKFENDLEETETKLKDKKGQKSWNLLNLQHHKHPYEDKKGWVTLDPVPWSVSKISKWKPKATEKPVPPNYYPNQNVWEDDTAESNDEYIYNKPQPEPDRYKVQYVNAEKPIYSKPFQSTHPLVQTNYHKTPIQVSNYHDNEENCNHQEIDGIITDGQLPNFPTRYSENRRSSTELQPHIHPFLGEGDWVLLSTTRGYKSPKRGQRSFDINAESIGTRKGVKLTVLPPLKNSKVNMTTSHGGMLQVESTFETVEQAQKKFQKNQLKNKKRKRLNKNKKRRKVVKEMLSSAITTIPKNTDSSAVLAGVGAGMIPATMAMLVPIAVNGKRRRKRHVFTTSDPSSIEITLPRYL